MCRVLPSLALALALVMAWLPPRAALATTTRPFLAYSPNSFFRKELPDNAPIDPDSDAGIAFAKSNNLYAFPALKGLPGNSWGMPFALSTCSDPLWRLTGSVPSEVAFLTTEGFHAPSNFGSYLTGTSDSPLVVIDTCGVPSMPNGLSVWASGASQGSGNTLNVGNAGAFQHDSNGLDRRNPASNSTKNFRSRGAIPDAMVIRKDMVDWAIANDSDLGHVLHLFWKTPDSSAGYVHPMVGTESPRTGWGPEGIRIRIKPSINLDSRGLSPCGLVIARTLQRYGAYIGDTAGNTTSLKMEQDHGQWGTLCTQTSLQGITWDDFEFVQRGWEPPLSTAPTLVGVTSANNDADLSRVVLSKPNGVVAGDLLLATVDFRGNPTVTPPSGWTLVRTDDNGNTSGKSTYYKFATGSEPLSYTFRLSNSTNAAVGALLAYRGVSATIPIDAHGGQADTSQDPSIVAPSIRTNRANTRLLFLGHISGNKTFTPPSGMAERYDLTTSVAQYPISGEGADQAVANAGATGSRTATASGNGTGIGQLIAIRPT